MKIFNKLLILSLFLLIITSCKKEKKVIDNLNLVTELEWEKLLGNDLNGWNLYLGFPQDSQEVEGLKRDENGKYLEPIGSGINLNNNFSVIMENNEPVLRISGEYYGGIITDKEYENYHLSLQVKWGTLVWEPRLELPPDSGILYHSIGENGVDYWRCWMLSQEMQVVIDTTGREGMGDYWSIANSEINIRAKYSEKDSAYYYNQKAESVNFVDDNYFCFRDGDFNKGNNEWDTLELITYKDKSLHIVNGHVVMVLTNSRYTNKEGKVIPLTKGKIQLQSEAAEVFYKDIKIKSIDSIPIKYSKYF